MQTKRLELTFDDPVPEDRAQIVTENQAGITGMWMTRNEARKRMGLDPIPGVDVFLMPITIQEVPANIAGKKGQETRKSYPLFQSEAQCEAYWTDYVKRAGAYEAKAIFALETLFQEQEKEALDKVKTASKDTPLIDITASKKRYAELMTPVLRAALSEAIQRGQELINPTNPHRSIKADVFTESALNWLKSRIGWAAAQVGEETASLLANQLAIGFEAGESIPQIATRVEQVFGFSNQVRAERIARTETIQASAKGSIEGYKASGVVDEVKFYAALDERTCEDCMSLHNEVFSIADSEGVITVHPSCRCVWIPIVK